VGFPAEDVWVSIFENDDEAFDIWKGHIGVPERKIVRWDARTTSGVPRAIRARAARVRNCTWTAPGIRLWLSGLQTGM
jgi:hypothetical protein